MELNTFIEQLGSNNSLDFEDTMAIIEANYSYTPVSFSNGDQHNEAGTNEGSCKIFAFAQLNQLSVEQTLACFGRFYRDDVLKNPEGTDHGNIRNFIKHGWEGVRFDIPALSTK
ncbi:MAG: HopJ type III effector protein [Amphritea sp.]|nr:HopJ type III effector protein [Amphritea sp.]